MRKMVVFVCLLWLAAAAAPLLFREGPAESTAAALPDAERRTAEDTGAADTGPEPAADAKIRVDVMADGIKNSFSLDEYLVGVLAAEMPASFPEAALRAQAVAARSFILRRVAHPPADGVHDGVPLCTDPAHCKGYESLSGEGEAEAVFGSGCDAAVARLRAAVAETDGVILTYEGEAALAAFHAISGGRTESAEDVWGEAVPYLIEVDSPGEESAVKYTETTVYEPGELRELLTAAFPEAELDGDPEGWLTSIRRSPAGMIKSASLGGAEVTGPEIRRVLGLNSADFTLSVRDGKAEIVTRGYGHGVGMSQYGARAMALSGADWREILLHYYPGCTLSSVDEV